MKKSVALIGAALAVTLLEPTAKAADLDYERDLGLIVSGVVDKWVGVQFSSERWHEDTNLALGGEALLSLPLGSSLSIQNDLKYEYNGAAAKSRNNMVAPRYSYQGASHLSWRNPSQGLFGAFGGFGTADFGYGYGGADFRFVGGEGQIYLDNLTFYAQGGFVDFSTPDELGLSDGLFVRGVMRWFPTADTRLQIEGTYLDADFGGGDPTDMEAFTAKARYDFEFYNMPIIGRLPLYIAYRGTFRDHCNGSYEIKDHTFMVGTSYSFSGDKLAIDRQGATLDTPDFIHECTQE